MTRRFGGVAVALLPALLAGCGPKEAVPNVHDSMTEVMEPTAQTIWDITSRAYNDVGDGLIASKISPADWAAVGKAAQQMRDRALLLANARQIAVVRPGDTILGAQAAGEPTSIGKEWKAASPEEVQAKIEANRPLFNQRAKELAAAADELARAALSKDTAVLYKVSSGLDENCDACHEPFWGTDENPPFPK